MKEITIDWCPTKQMIADFMTEPQQRRQFRNVKDYITGRIRCNKPNKDVIKVVERISWKLIKKAR
jgi:hypothetical protein